jgi:hypothetical protein
MKKNLIIIFALIILVFIGYNGATFAQPGGQRTNGKMIYHDGPVLTGGRNLYYIFYGCWGMPECGNMGDNATMTLLTDFAISIGGSPYMQINSTYPDSAGQAPTGYFIFGGLLVDNSYSRGVELTRADVIDLISEKVNNFQLPQDRNGIYVILTSSDISANDMGFCATGAPPFHSTGLVNGSPVIYTFIGNARRCPTTAGAAFFGPGGTGFTTPNGTFSGDAMAANLAHSLNGTLTNPQGNGWYDRYGLENADKCAGSIGTTYTTANGATANVHLAGRDYLFEQNWVNDRKGRCALSR